MLTTANNNNKKSPHVPAIKLIREKQLIFLVPIILLKLRFLLVGEKKIIIFGKIDSLTHLHSKNVYFYIHYSYGLKVMPLSYFSKFLGWHQPLFPYIFVKVNRSSAT